METDWVVIVPSGDPGMSWVRLVPRTLKPEQAVERVVRELGAEGIVDGTVWAFPMSEVIGFMLEAKVVATRTTRTMREEG